MIKMIAVDMDGTLLNENREISGEVLAAIGEAEAAGVRIVIATGRAYSSAMADLKRYSFRRRYILASGGEIRDEEEQVERRVPLDYGTVKQLYECCSRYPVLLHFCGEDKDYAVGTQDEIHQAVRVEMSAFLGLPMDEVENNDFFWYVRNQLKGLDSIEDMKNYVVFKAFIFSEDKDILAGLNRELCAIPRVVSASSFSTNLEITDELAQKGEALREVAKKLGYSLDEVMAIGDSPNDESMLKLPLGASVAMGNACEKLKKICPYQTRSNERDGVAYAIRLALKDRLEDMKNPDYAGD